MNKKSIFLQKIFKNLFFEWFSWKVTLTRPPLFSDGRHFLWWSTLLKSQTFWRKSQKSPKIVKKLDIFQKFDFSHPGSDWLPKRDYLCLIFDLCWKNNFFLWKVGFFDHFSEKVECWPPQPRKKCMKEWFNQKMPLRTFRTLAKSCPHAKF